MPTRLTPGAGSYDALPDDGGKRRRSLSDCPGTAGLPGATSSRILLHQGRTAVPVTRYSWYFA